jgi:hypothetical protein
VAEHLTPDEVSAVYGCLEGRLGIGVLHDSDGWTDPERRAFWSALRKLVHMYGPDETLVSLNADEMSTIVDSLTFVVNAGLLVGSIRSDTVNAALTTSLEKLSAAVKKRGEPAGV